MKTSITFEITEAANQSGVRESLIRKFISYQWVNPADPEDLKLDEEDIARIQLISELKDELGVNDEAVPIILHLIDELNHLHIQFREKVYL